ncbi:Hsp20/alpha crystallin family protein [Desmospora profundinema]|uniref:HSP20 family protein n=1 Tax=Desmospora profundinema TaxID=1571184 RepID=A0ABU1IS41_9BACL|nr:Hsp20 family protein [Desmospora profundinema]MDR6227614.1 HSP20 family protein [Desmospora profundinema]
MNPHQQFSKWSRLARQFLGDDFWAEMEETVPIDKSERPLVDVYHGNEDVLVLIELPGIQDLSQVVLRVEGRALWLRGEIPSRKSHYRAVVRERYTGSFERKVDLGVAVSRRHHRARYRRGIIELLLKKDRNTPTESPSIRVSEN